MEISFSLFKDKEIVNIYDGKKLGHATDVCFDKNFGTVLGIVVPGEKKLFKKAEEIFIPISNIKKIGEDVVLVKLSPDEPYSHVVSDNNTRAHLKDNRNHDSSIIYKRYRRPVQKEI